MLPSSSALADKAIARLDRLQRSVDRALKKGRLKSEACNETDPPTADYALDRDRKGRVRRFTSGYGSEDSVMVDVTYYDLKGRPRLITRTAGAVNGTHLNIRFYYNTKGVQFARRDKKEGVGYPFGEVILEKDPTLAFQKACAEL